MKYLLQQKRLQYLIKNRNGYLMLGAGSLLLNFLLVFVLLLMLGNERIILVPPAIEKTFWVSKDHASSEYLSEMGLFFTNFRFNLTPSNMELQRRILLTYVYPTYYEKFKTELLAEEERYKKEHLTTIFFPVNVKSDASKLMVEITGDLASMVGDSSLPTKRVVYQIRFSFDQGRLLVKALNEVKQNA